MSTRIATINRCLARVGERAIQSEAVAGADRLIAAHGAVTDFIFSDFDWACGRTVRELARLAEAPSEHWAYAFQLPSDRLGPPTAYFSTKDLRCRQKTFETRGDTVLVDDEALWARYARVPDPLDIPGYLREAIDVALMAEFAFIVREDRALRDRFRREAYGPDGYGGLVGHARSKESQARPPKRMPLDENPLLSVRRG